MADFIYMDSAAMHPPLPCAIDAFRTSPFGNPSSEHAIGQSARNALEQAREKIAKLMDCEPHELYFTSTATEAAALVMNSLAQCQHDTAEPSDFEHHAISENIVQPRGWTFPNVYFAQMLANNETGEIFRENPKCYDGWICDATAAVGHIPVSFRGLGCDYLIADGIKFGGLPGAAFLIAKQDAPLSPLIRGGGQERGMRSGTENVPAICAMAAALEWQTEHMEDNIGILNGMRFFLINKLLEIKGSMLNTPYESAETLPQIINISFKGVDAKALVLLLSKDGIMVSAGAACSNGLNEPSHVLMAMFNDEARARSAIRISLSHENTLQECEQAAEKIADCVAYLRSIS